MILVMTLGAPDPSLALKWPGYRNANPLSAENAVLRADAETQFGQEIQGALQSGISEGIRKAALAIRKPPEPLHKNLEIGEGDTIGGLLQKAGLSGGDAYNAVQALSEYYDPRKIKPGQALEIRYKRDRSSETEERVFSELKVNLDPLKEVTISKEDEGKFVSRLEEKPLENRTRAHYAEIETSLYGSAVRAGIPAQVVAEIIRVYSWNVDFQRDIRQGDRIEIMYETEETKDGEYVKNGNILYANLTVGGREKPIYRFEMSDGHVDYFEPGGHSIRKVLMKTPIDGARLSSGFGMRHHPILGYNKMHKGIDFAAARGTPIYAAGDGTIDYAGRKGGYGNYIRIRHNSQLKTAYAHMKGFAKGISNGKRVKQGEAIGYVGTTGRSTGPHLHYEVLKNNVQVNPRSIDLPIGEQLAGKDLKKFEALKNDMDGQYVALTRGMKVAQHKIDQQERYN